MNKKVFKATIILIFFLFFFVSLSSTTHAQTEPCGILEQACCDGFYCDGAAVCDNNICVECGGLDQLCCRGLYCDSYLTCDSSQRCVDIVPGVVKVGVIGLKEINFSFFPIFRSFDARYATVLSWASFIGTLLTIGIVIFWIFLIVKTSIQVILAEGVPEKIAEGTKKIKSVFIGMAITFVFPAILILVGLIVGLGGNVFEWPKLLSSCEQITQIKGERVGFTYYFQALLRADEIFPEGWTSQDLDNFCRR